MAGLYVPLPTLRSHPRGGLRTDRGRRGLLLLHRSGLSPHTPCQSPGALTIVRHRICARNNGIRIVVSCEHVVVHWHGSRGTIPEDFDRCYCFSFHFVMYTQKLPI